MSLQLNNLSPAPGSKKEAHRVGRGIGSGLGKTAGRGHKGQKARKGGGIRSGFEGGQTPLMRRLPKRGFSNYGFRKEVQIVNLERIASLELDTVNVTILHERGVIKKTDIPVKILGNGELKNPIEITADMFSKSAIEKLEKAGGKAIYK